MRVQPTQGKSGRLGSRLMWAGRPRSTATVALLAFALLVVPIGPTSAPAADRTAAEPGPHEDRRSDDPTSDGPTLDDLLADDPAPGDPGADDDAPLFGDIPSSHRLVREIGWLVDVGVIEGFGDGTFRPGATVARGQLAAMLFRLSFNPDTKVFPPCEQEVVGASVGDVRQGCLYGAYMGDATDGGVDHALVLSHQVLGESGAIPWSAPLTATGATSHTDGLANTNDIFMNQSLAQSPVFEYAVTNTLNDGRTPADPDFWYVPAKDELDLVYDFVTTNGGPATWIDTTAGAGQLWLHWSSTESAISTPINPAPAAWLQFFGSGNAGLAATDSKSSATNRRVRLMRRVAL